MKARLRHFASSPWVHPALFAAFPVVFLWSQNLDQGVTTLHGFVVLVGAMLLAMLILLGLRLILRDLPRAAVATSVIVTVLLNLGRIEAGMNAVAGSLAEHLLVVELVVLSLAAVLAVRKFRPSAGFTRTLNLIGAVLVLMNVVPILVVQESASAAEFKFPALSDGLDAGASGSERDVYYVIFDRYAGAETLSNLYGFDNSAFYRWLSNQGFTVTSDALANYPQTTHSLASSLNMSYLDDLASVQGVGSSEWAPIRGLLQDSAVARTFQAMGYKYEHIGSWWDGTAFDRSADDNYVYGVYTEFLGAFVGTTALPALERQFGIQPGFDKEEWDRVHYQVRALNEIAANPEPTFTFAHFLLPHPPYIFHADGSFVASDSSRPVEQAYIDQLQYSNHVIEQIVSSLQAGPGPSPIIVIQSDEGPYPPASDRSSEILNWSWSKASDVELGRKLRILNAYYLPGDLRTRPYPAITPVNTFRLILNDYFGAELPLLPDRTYIFTDPYHLYNFEDVTDRLRTRGPP